VQFSPQEVCLSHLLSAAGPEDEASLALANERFEQGSDVWVQVYEAEGIFRLWRLHLTVPTPHGLFYLDRFSIEVPALQPEQFSCPQPGSCEQNCRHLHPSRRSLDDGRDLLGSKRGSVLRFLVYLRSINHLFVPVPKFDAISVVSGHPSHNQLHD
jgi:hypothetical protein